jgi:choice-of-anchor C domain-containing protein
VGRIILGRSLILLPLILLPAAAISQAQEASLIVNGSFEDGPRPPRFVNLAGGSDALRGWVVTGEGVDHVGPGYWTSSEGTHAVDLDGSARSRLTPPFAHGGITQTFATTPGATYRVTFDLSGNPYQKPDVKLMRVSAAGQEAEFSFDITGRNARNMGWLSTEWTFTANDVFTTLEFQSLTVSPATGWGPAIDNVSVTALDRPPHQLQITENEQEIQVNLEAGVLFDTGKYDLKPAATEALQELVGLLNNHPDFPILIEGHTDSVGTPEANQILSESRANAVKEWLTANGKVSSNRITTKGYGQTIPVAPNDTPEGRQKNRRVEIKLQKKAAL